jgi:O-antigen ligase
MSAQGALRRGGPLAIGPVAAAIVAGMTVGLLAAYQPIGALALAIAPIIAAIALYRLPIAVAMWIPLMFIEGLPGSRLAPELFGLFVGVGWVAALRLGTLNGAFEHARTLLFGLGAMLSWFVLSLLWAHDLSSATGYGWYFFEVAIFLVMIATVPRDTSTVKLFFAMFVVGAVISVFIGAAGAVRGDAAVEQGSRLQGGAGDPNYFAAALMPALAISIGLARAAVTRATRYWSLAATLPLIFGVAASQSRGAIVAGVVMAIVSLFVFPRERFAIVLCILAVVGIGSIYFMTDRGAWERITTDQYGGSGREDLWRVGTRVYRDNPVLGVGLDNFSKVSVDYLRQPGSLTYVKGIQRGQEVHNAYLAMLVEVGPLGLLLFLWAPFWCLASALAAAKRYQTAGMPGMSALSRATFVALCGTLTTSIFLPNAADKRLWVLMALIVALGAVARRVSEQQTVAWAEPPEPAAPPLRLAPGLP